MFACLILFVILALFGIPLLATGIVLINSAIGFVLMLFGSVLLAGMMINLFLDIWMRSRSDPFDRGNRETTSWHDGYRHFLRPR